MQAREKNSAGWKNQEQGCTPDPTIEISPRFVQKESEAKSQTFGLHLTDNRRKNH